MMLHQISVDSPIGPLRLRATDDALVAVYLPDQEAPRLAEGPAPSLAQGGHAVLERAKDQLAQYFAGERRSFDLPLEPRGTAFQQEVWRALRAIPFGATRSYAELAAALGRPSASRAVGGANGRNPLSIVVPCHRVVGADGSLTGYAGGLARKEWLLEHERAGAET
jgi:methylated-DNA-[protein]-cysteine S-methyltransferase